MSSPCGKYHLTLISSFFVVNWEQFSLITTTYKLTQCCVWRLMTLFLYLTLIFYIHGNNMLYGEIKVSFFFTYTRSISLKKQQLGYFIYIKNMTSLFIRCCQEASILRCEQKKYRFVPKKYGFFYPTLAISVVFYSKKK